MCPWTSPARLDVAQEIEHLLRAPDGEGGDDDVAAPVEGALDDLGEAFGIVGRGIVEPVAVGGFHDDVIRLRDIARVVDEGLVEVAHIARKRRAFW